MVVEDHVGEIKRSTRTVKEESQCHVHRFPYEICPKIMIVGCVEKKNKDLNQIPAENSTFDTASSSTLITGRARLDYVQVKILTSGTMYSCISVRGRLKRTKHGQ